MKNSAWDSKLLRKKLDKLPVKGDAASAWGNMQQMLDAHLPVSTLPATTTTTPVAAKSVVAKIVSMAAYVLPAAAMVGAATWFAVKPPTKQKTTLKNDRHKEYRLNADSVNRITDSRMDSIAAEDRVAADSAGVDNADTLTAYNGNLKKDSSSIPKNGASESNGVFEKDKVNPGDDVLSGNNQVRGNVSSKEASKTLKENVVRVPDNSIYSNKKQDNTEAPSAYNAANERSDTRRMSSAHLDRLTKGNINLKKNKSTHGNNNGKVNYESNKTGSKRNEQGDLSAKRSKVQLSNYVSPGLTFNDLPAAQQSYDLFIYKDKAGVMTGNKSMLLTDAKTGAASNSNMNKFADSKPTPAKTPKNKMTGRLNTPALNFGLEAGLNLSKGAGLYGGLTADYAVTNRLLIGAGLRFSSGSKLRGSYSHPSFFRPDSAAAFTITEERKVSAIQVPLNLTYKLSSLISIKAGAVINFSGNPGSTGYVLGPVGGFRDTLRRAASIDSAVSKSVVTGRVSLGFTGGVSLHFKKLSIDARYLALPPYRVNNPLGNYSSSNNAFQIGVTYSFKPGTKN